MSKYGFNFKVLVKCLKNCYPNEMYEIGEEIEIDIYSCGNSEEEVRRKIINREMGLNRRILKFTLIRYSELEIK